MTLRTESESETIEAGRRLAEQTSPGTVVLLYGELGSGKTAFVRGLAHGLGVDPDEVSSPTFTLVHEYRGRVRLYHVDLYRLDAREVDDLGLDDLTDESAVVAIEWADRLSRPIPGAVVVRIEDRGGDVREITISTLHSER